LGDTGHLVRSWLFTAATQRGAGRAVHRALRGQLCGTRIRHCPPPLDVRPLPISMVLAAFVTGLVACVGACLRQPVASRSTIGPAV